MTTFARFHSLGWNCEAGLYLRAEGYAEAPDYFVWCTTPFSTLYHLIEQRFARAFERENLVQSGFMIEDARFPVLATHQPSEARMAEFDGDVDRLLDFVADDRARRAKHFLDELKSGEPIGYILKYEGRNARFHARRLRLLLGRMGAPAASHLIVVQERAREGAPWNIPGVSNRYVSAFPRFDQLGSYDHASWREALAPFSIAPHMALAA